MGIFQAVINTQLFAVGQDGEWAVIQLVVRPGERPLFEFAPDNMRTHDWTWPLHTIIRPYNGSLSPASVERICLFRYDGNLGAQVSMQDQLWRQRPEFLEGFEMAYTQHDGSRYSVDSNGNIVEPRR